MIINTLAYRKEGYKQLLHIAKSFEVDVMLVLDKELLYNLLLKEMRNESIKKLVIELLNVDYNKRPSIKQILKTDFFKDINFKDPK